MSASSHNQLNSDGEITCQTSLETLPFAKEFIRTCADGWRQGWHESNGGNLSYLLSEAEAKACKDCLDDDGEWVPLKSVCSALGGSFLLVTASGSHLRNVEVALGNNAGVVELNENGTAWRAVWGFAGGARPTSELEAHLQCYEAKAETGKSAHVVYHVHPAEVIALSALLPADERAVTRALWTATTECVIAFPSGVGALPWMIPGSSELAAATAEALRKRDAVLWARHGILVAGASFDEAFGRVQTAEKAAKVWLALEGEQTISDISTKDILAISKRYGLDIAEELL